jgi:hypothetical protein
MFREVTLVYFDHHGKPVKKNAELQGVIGGEYV